MVRSAGSYPRQRGSSEVIVHVQNIGEQGLGGGLLDVQLLHLLGHHDGLPGDLLARPAHLEEPGEPLEEDDGHLRHTLTSTLKDRLDKLSQTTKVCWQFVG